MVRNNVWTGIVGALITVGCLATARAAPVAPIVVAAPLSSPADLASFFWGRPYPYGYAYLPGQCYTQVEEDTPKGPVWRRVWICPGHPGGR